MLKIISKRLGHSSIQTTMRYAYLVDEQVSNATNDLRHTHASISLQAKIPLEIISKRLGHSSIQTTMRYAHLADDQMRQATNDLSKTLGKAMGI